MSRREVPETVVYFKQSQKAQCSLMVAFVRWYLKAQCMYKKKKKKGKSKFLSVWLKALPYVSKTIYNKRHYFCVLDISRIWQRANAGIIFKGKKFRDSEC